MLLLLVFSCSTKKNTGVTRYFHNLTSHYNILFNGEESYKKGMERLVEMYDDNLSELLPVFLYTNKEAIATIGPEMDRSIKKATKLISMHSLTVKPKVKPDKELTQKQKEFYSKREFNKYVDDAYLLMGKAHFYKMEYGRSKETFNYLIANYPEETTVFETRLWIARLANEEGRFREAEDILNSLTNNLEYPKDIEGELYATWADYYLKQEKFEQAIDPLLKATENTKQKSIRIRYTYLIAQLYAKTGNNRLATEYYGKVISMNPPYKMTFSAKINQALTYQAGAGPRKDIEKQLDKMLRDDKNIDYQDQVYYAIGNLYFKDGKIDEAIEFYKLSLQAGKDDNRQKAKTNLTLADIYYAQPNYVSAQAYYDSTVAVIDLDYPNYKEIYTKSVSLNKLVENILIVEFEDSVLKLAKMPEEELLAYIDNIIEEERQAEEDKRRLEQELAQDRLDNMLYENTQNRSNQGEWYFYNPTAKSLGKKEFASVWGNRKLEDNWRRKNKRTVDFGEVLATEEEEADSTSENTGGSLVTNRKSREFYLQYIPFTDSAKNSSLDRVANGLYNMGLVYGDELKDYPDAIKSHETLLSRFPKFEDKLQAYWKLYTNAKAIKDIERVSRYQQRIISEYPNSNFAKLMTNPNYLEEVQAQERRIYVEYERTLDIFNAHRYDQSGNLADKAMKEHPDHVLYPKFDYISTVSSGVRKDTLSFIKDLQALITNYPTSDLANNAQILIDYLQNSSPDVIEKQNLEIARELYSLSPEEAHFFLYVVPTKLDINQLIFNIVNFNLEYFDSEELEVKRVGLEDKNMLCVVQRFKNSKEAMNYLGKIKVDPTIFRDVNSNGILPVIISQSNFNKLKESGQADQYIPFFSENY